jgi:poly-beta-1,6-N-acetyl-D-glucosamine biosynthesis protein PgaD
MLDNTYIVSIKPIDRGHRTRDTVLTFLMWGIYVYLWVPLITLGAWLVGFERFYEIMITYGGFDVVLELLDWYAVIIITIAACVVSWSAINYGRFHNRERRYAAPVTNTSEISEFFGIARTEVDRIRTSRRLQIDLDEFGGIANITHYGYSGTDDPPICVELRKASLPES